ncbi:MAG: hypothetical protein QNJ53_19565 [Pleurocapsa sp. MO_192.B19]|nr:hypothetical protein [Pleurocapsa sp. MO_192.B19]
MAIGFASAKGNRRIGDSDRQSPKNSVIFFITYKGLMNVGSKILLSSHSGLRPNSQ